MKRITYLLFFSILSYVNYSCGIKGSGNIETVNRDLPTFSGIELRGAADVYIRQGEIQSVSVEAEENLLSDIIMTVNDNELLIDVNTENYPTRPVNVHITVTELSLLELTGAGSMTTLNSLDCETLTLRLSGSGKILTNTNTQQLKASLAGTGNLELRGSAEDADIRIVGSGNVEAQNLKTQRAVVSISGEGSGTVDVIEQLVANLSGIGYVYYINEPNLIQSRITGTGDVLKI